MKPTHLIEVEYSDKSQSHLVLCNTSELSIYSDLLDLFIKKENRKNSNSIKYYGEAYFNVANLENVSKLWSLYVDIYHIHKKYYIPLDIKKYKDMIIKLDSKSEEDRKLAYYLLIDEIVSVNYLRNLNILIFDIPHDSDYNNDHFYTKNVSDVKVHEITLNMHN